jgi:anti-anti-sigma factor
MNHMSRPAKAKAIHELSVEAEPQEGRYRVLLRGELDLTSAPNLTKNVARLCSDGASSITLDMSELAFIDSTGLRAILNSRALCEESVCDFWLMPGPEEIHQQLRRLFEITGLLGRLPFRPSGEARG